MLLNALWLTIFTKYNLTAFFISCIDIFGLLGTCLFMMMIVSRNNLNKFEVISAYTGFSMYAGWVTTATILNIAFCLKGVGFNVGSNVSCYILWIVQIIYIIISYKEQNVVYGTVWLWAAFAILNRQKENHKDIEANLDLIIIVHGVFLFGLSIMKCTVWIQG